MQNNDKKYFIPVTALLGLDSLIGGSSFLRTCVVLLSSVPTGGKPVL